MVRLMVAGLEILYNLQTRAKKKQTYSQSILSNSDQIEAGKCKNLNWRLLD